MSFPTAAMPRRSRRQIHSRSADDVTLARPTAGFVGHISERIDITTLEAVAATGVSLLLVGPVSLTSASERLRVAYRSPKRPVDGAAAVSGSPSLSRGDVGRADSLRALRVQPEQLSAEDSRVPGGRPRRCLHRSPGGASVTGGSCPHSGHAPGLRAPHCEARQQNHGACESDGPSGLRPKPELACSRISVPHDSRPSCRYRDRPRKGVSGLTHRGEGSGRCRDEGTAYCAEEEA